MSSSDLSPLETQVFSMSAQVSPLRGEATQGPDELKDLGFGTLVSGTTHRLLNKDGSFNVRREGYDFFRSQSLYHTTLNISWPKFFTLISALYLFINLIFATAYYACGPNALEGTRNHSELGRFSEDFFFQCANVRNSWLRTA